MSAQNDPNAGASRELARARLRNLTRAALFATTGAAVCIGIVVAHEHPGKTGAGATTSGHSSGTATGSSGSTGSTGNTGGSGNSGSTGNTGNSGSSTSPSISSQTPSVTSGGSGR